jgi:DNA polymerase III subunit beta
MKLEINSQKLKDIIGLTEHVAGKHVTLPVLSCILIDVKGRTALFKSTNLDIGIEVEIPVKADSDGTIAVPAHILSSFVSQIYGQNQLVKMELVSGNIHISCGKSKGVIKTVPADDFPTIPKIADGEKLEMPSEALIKGLQSVWYSASTSNVKPELSSVYIYSGDGGLTFVATDSFRLAERKIQGKTASKMRDVLVPFKNISSIIRILEYIGDMVTVQINKNLISFEGNGVYAASRIIDGVFPDYRQILPKSFVTEAIVLKQDFQNALKISNIFSDKFNRVKLIVDPKAKLFEIYTKNSDVGENQTAIDGALTGERMEVNFNYRYMIDCLQAIDADSISLQMGGLNKAVVIKPVSGDQNFTYLVMPMNR